MNKFVLTVFILSFFLFIPKITFAATIFTETFEGAFPGTSWTVGDSQSSNGSDYWDDTSDKYYAGSWSGWCADIGDNSVYGGTNDSVQKYDNYMDAYMYRTVSLSSYNSANLTYYYWLNSESCCDSLYVTYYSGSTWYFIDEHKGGSSSWTSSSVSIPTSATKVGFQFYSDSSVVYEGAYLDNITLEAVSCQCSSGTCCDGCRYISSGTACGYSSWNGCNGSCQKKRDIYKCSGSSATCPTTDQGDDFANCSANTYCSGGSCISGSCGTKTCPAGSSGSCTKYCDGYGTCDCTLSCTETNCCDNTDNDGDGYEDGFDSNCQADQSLSAGANTICWETEWDDYGNGRDYYSGWFTCPAGQIVSSVNITQYTEATWDFFYMYDANSTERYKDSGLDGTKTADLSSYNTQKVKFRFTSDGSAVYDGVKVNTITCAVGCSSLNYPTDKWQRVWYDISSNCLGNGPDEPNEEFSNDWGSGVLAYTRSDNIMFLSSKTIYIPTTANYKFILGSDDGSELFIDGVSRINLWSDHGYEEKSTILNLSASNHQFKINYYERTGGAMVLFDILSGGADLDCYNESVRRGFATGDCYKRNDFVEYHPCLETYSAYDPIGSYGSCSPNSIYNCETCHNCPTSPPSDSVTVGSATVNITGTGRDATVPANVPGFHRFDKGTNWRSYHMDENRDPLDRCGNRSCAVILWCWTGLDVKHTWTTTGDQITVTTDMIEKNTSDNLGAGFNLNSSYKFTSISADASSPELFLQTGTDSQQGSCLTGTKFYGINTGAVAGAWVKWTLDVEYCGDGECNCGETCTSCVGDCGSCDTTPPVVSVTSVPLWKRASSYLVEITDTEPESTLELCRYKIEEWTSGGGSYVGTVKAVTDRACNSPIGITAGVSTILNKEAHQAWYKFIATAKNNVLPTEGTNSVWLKFDFTPPGTTIQ